MSVTTWRTRTATRATARRLGWGLADQAVSSVTNFVLGLVVARSLGATSFGAFTLAWVTYGVVLNVSRGLATDPLTVRYSGPADARWRAAIVRAASTALAVGLVVGTACVLGGLAVGHTVGPSFVALGITLPGLMLQDSWRYAFFSSGQGKRAFLNDSVWAVVLVPAMLIADATGTAFAFVLAWGVPRLWRPGSAACRPVACREPAASSAGSPSTGTSEPGMPSRTSATARAPGASLRARPDLGAGRCRCRPWRSAVAGTNHRAPHGNQPDGCS